MQPLRNSPNAKSTSSARVIVMLDSTSAVMRCQAVSASGACLHPRLPARRFAGHMFCRLIAVHVEGQRGHHHRAELDGAECGGAGPRRIEHQQCAKGMVTGVFTTPASAGLLGGKALSRPPRP